MSHVYQDQKADDVHSLIQDFAARVRSDRALPVVQKAFGAAPLVGHQVIQFNNAPPEPVEKPALSGARTQRLDVLLVEAARHALSRIDGIRRHISVRDIREAFDAAVVQHCAAILDASKIDRKKADKEREKIVTEHRAARQALSDKLQTGRKRLRALSRALTHAEKEVARLNDRISLLDTGEWPAVPPASITPSRDGADLPSGPGIYFLWKEGVVVYVGKSRQICTRLKLGGHHVLGPGHRISYVALDERLITWAECYYIGVLRPIENFGSNASHRR